MRGSGIISLVVSAILATLPAATFGHGPGGGGRHAFSSNAVGFGRFGSALTPGWAGSAPGWGWFGRPGAFGASPSGLTSAPFHSPYAAPFWAGNPSSLTMKPDEATVLESESRMEEQIRALQDASPKSESSEKGHGAASDADSGDWQPL
ncbi:MAG TPA: hypothetical protein VK714_08160 [Myxococcota bacterium]|nr:hypothetical protein [Myxococcota bacterium]